MKLIPAFYLRLSTRSGNRPRRLLRRPLIAMIALYLLFAHGCHGNEDADLLVRLPVIVANTLGLMR